MSNENSGRKSSSRSARLAYLPHMIIFSLLYFVFAITYSRAQHVAFVPAFSISLMVFALLSAAFFFVAPFLRRLDRATPDSLPAKILFGSPSKTAGDANKDDEMIQAQEKIRREARIKALEFDARSMQDRVLRVGAILSIALVLFWVIMNSAFELSPSELYMIPWPAIAALWFFQIVLFPKWMTYTSFLTFIGMRIALIAFGPSILMLLPNFIMLPIFYLLMMVFMFGSIMLPNLMRIKYNKPGEGGWEVAKGSVRGQFGAQSVIETQVDRFVRYVTGQSKHEPITGMVLSGPPGTGKTLYAKQIATTLGLPFINADAADLNPPFAGMAPIMLAYVFWKIDALANQYKGCVVFIDEGDTLFGARSGMKMPGGRNTRPLDEWDFLYKNNSCMSFDVPWVRTRQWNEQQMAAFVQQASTGNGKDLFMMPGNMGGGGGAIDSFLTKMSGTGSASLAEKSFRRMVNDLLSAFFVPVKMHDKILRLSPAKVQKAHILWVTATNRFWMFDPAMIRPHRFDIVVEFVMPDEDERADIAGYYFRKQQRLGFYQEGVLGRVREFAQSTPNTSPAEIEQIIEEAVDVRVQHVAELRRIKHSVDNGNLDTLSKPDQKFWLRFKDTVYAADGKEIAGWDDERVDWHALMETRSTINFGRADPGASNETTRRRVAFHELGHFVALKAFNGNRIKPTLLTVIPRRGSLGMVAHVPYDTREQHPQEYYEGLVRTSVASWVTERFFFGQNLPGVSGDLETATNIAVLMHGKFGMPHFECTPQKQRYYQEMGSPLISAPQISMFEAPQAKDLFASVLGSPEGRRGVAITLGMAAEDAYREIRRNKGIFLKYIPELLALDEFSGGKLEDLWKRFDDELTFLNDMSDGDKKVEPKRAFAARNSFYGETDAEGADVYEEVLRLVNEAQS